MGRWRLVQTPAGAIPSVVMLLIERLPNSHAELYGRPPARIGKRLDSYDRSGRRRGPDAQPERRWDVALSLAGARHQPGRSGRSGGKVTNCGAGRAEPVRAGVMTVIEVAIGPGGAPGMFRVEVVASPLGRRR